MTIFTYRYIRVLCKLLGKIWKHRYQFLTFSRNLAMGKKGKDRLSLFISMLNFNLL